MNRRQVIEIKTTFSTAALASVLRPGIRFSQASATITDDHQLPTIREMFGDGAVPFREHLILSKCDINTLAVDVIVNAANQREPSVNDEQLRQTLGADHYQCLHTGRS